MYDIIVVGGGVVGLTCALDFAKHLPSMRVALIAANTPNSDRTYAISPSNIMYLNSLGYLTRNYGTVNKMNIYGPSSSLSINNQIAQRLYLAKIIYESDLIKQLTQLITQTNIITITDTISKIEQHATHITLHSATQSYTTKLVIGADGANSMIRQLFNISVSRYQYTHKAITANFTCEKYHDNTAYQWFQSNGNILAYLPLNDHQISIVWSNASPIITDDFANMVAGASNYALGELTLITQPIIHPISLQIPHTTITSNLVLIGDAAHTIHPLAGLGLNLGLQDTKQLVLTIVNNQPLAKYATMRSIEVRKMQFACHALRVLFSNIYSGKIANLGLNMINNSNLIKKYLIKQVI